MAKNLGTKTSGRLHSDASAQAGSWTVWIRLFWGIVCSLLDQSALLGQDLTAESLYFWDFKRSDVRISDQWPVGWKRRHDRQHPAYVDIRVVPRDPLLASAALEARPAFAQLWAVWKNRDLATTFNPERIPQPVMLLHDALVDNCLEIKMNGAAAEIIGPVVALDDRFNYSLDAVVECQELNGHNLLVEFHLLDRNLKQIEKLTTGTLHGNVPWKQITSGNMNGRTSGFKFGQVHITVSPLHSRHLSGVVHIDNIRINRIPRLELTVDAKLHVARVGQAFTLSCSAVGISGNYPNPSVRMQILDELDNVIREESIALERIKPITAPAQIASPKTKTNHYVSADSTQQPASLNVFDGLANWTTHIDAPGYYHARVYLGEIDGQHSDREIPLVVIDELVTEAASPFGWALPAGLSSEQIRAIPQLVRTYGAGRIKIPIWLDASIDADKIDQLAWLIERLQSQKLICVGVIDQPPASQRKHFDDDQGQLPITTIFQNSKTWEPLIEPILTRMSMKLNWFQLGSDDAHNFMANPQLNKAIADIKQKMQPYSQELQIAIAWSWLNGLPQNEPLAWHALQLSSQPQLTAEELEYYSISQAHNGSIRWCSLNFLSADKYTLIDRVRDLVERLTILKKSGISAAFVPRPMDPNVGLFNADFEPQAMSVPWRTLSQHIGPAAYVGNINLSHGSTNHIFENENEGVMLAWKELPTVEQLYLGDNITAIDMWGRSLPVKVKQSARGQAEQCIEVGPWPTLIRGVDLRVAKFRMQFNLKATNLLSVIGREQSLPIQLTNTFGQAIRGKMELVAPTLLQNGIASMPLILSKGQTVEKELPLHVRSDASAGKHDVRFDFELNSDKTYHFSTYRTLSLGFDDIEMDWQVVKSSDTQLVLRLEITNRAERETTFNCKFFPPPFPYQHFQIERVPVGTSSREFTMSLPSIDDNAEYWIRCEEAGNRRTLNYRVRISKVD